MDGAGSGSGHWVLLVFLGSSCWDGWISFGKKELFWVIYGVTELVGVAVPDGHR